MNTEELRILLRTVADTSGAQQTQQALTGVQRQAAQTGRAAATATAGIGAGFNISAGSIVRFGAALAGVNVGLSLFTTAGQVLQQVLADATTAFVTAERVTRAASAAYGSMAGDWIRFADRMSAATGQSRTAILEAALSARTLSANYGLTVEQTRRLIQVSADLAQIRGIGIAESFERIQSAIRGEAEASEYLGLTLNDTFIKNNALNGSLKNTFETMSDAQKAQIRYGEVLRQTAQFSGLAASSADTLEGAQKRSAAASEQFSRVLGGMLAPALRDVNNLQAASTDSLSRWFEQFSKVPTPQEMRNRAVEAYKNLPQIGPPEVPPIKSDFIGQVDRSKSGIDALNESLTKLGINPAVAKLAELAPRTAPMHEADVILRRLAADMEVLGQRASELGTIMGGLPIGDVLLRSAIAAEQSMTRIDNAVTARAAAVQRVARTREIEQGLTRVYDPRDAAGAEAARSRLVLTQQIEGAQREVLDAQARSTALQQQSVQLSAQEAALRLSMLPAQQRMLELQRGVAEQQARARLAAMPATEALEDLRYLQERARLIASSRDVPVEERVAARRSIRELARAEPRAALSALEASRSLVPSQRASERLGIEAQLAEIQRQRELAPVEILQQQNQHLATIAAAITAQQEQRLLLRLEVSTDGGAPLVYQELIEANGQAHTPPVIQVSAVRRN